MGQVIKIYTSNVASSCFVSSNSTLIVIHKVELEWLAHYLLSIFTFVLEKVMSAQYSEPSGRWIYK